jgi:hypothetical protein
MDIMGPRPPPPLLRLVVVVEKYLLDALFPLMSLLISSRGKTAILRFCHLQAPSIWLIVARIARPFARAILFLLLGCPRCSLAQMAMVMPAIYTIRAPPILPAFVLIGGIILPLVEASGPSAPLLPGAPLCHPRLFPTPLDRLVVTLAVKGIGTVWLVVTVTSKGRRMVRLVVKPLRVRFGMVRLVTKFTKGVGTDRLVVTLAPTKGM